MNEYAKHAKLLRVLAEHVSLDLLRAAELLEEAQYHEDDVTSAYVSGAGLASGVPTRCILSYLDGRQEELPLLPQRELRIPISSTYSLNDVEAKPISHSYRPAPLKEIIYLYKEQL